MENIVIDFRHILCPIDLSESSIGPLVHAARLARWYDARLTVLHVVPAFDPVQVPSGVLGEPVRIVYPMASEVENVVVIGRAHREILGAATDRDADLIVMGAQGRGGIELALFGSTTQQVVRGATCPVLTVRGTNNPQAASAHDFFQECPA